jgi:hypothetical protein
MVIPSGAVSAGNALVQRAFGGDTVSGVFVVLPDAKLPAGSLESFRYWNQGSGGKVIRAYVLRPAGVPNRYMVVYDSGPRTSPVPVAPGGEVATVDVPSSVAVAADDVIGFYGQGIALDLTGSDQVSYPAPVAPVVNSTMTLGVDPGFPIFRQSRTYSFAATVTPPGT